MFQSLFFWNHCLDLVSLSKFFRKEKVSILVFLEPLLRLTGLLVIERARVASILVFLEPLLRPQWFSKR